ncbi:hypothetical protein [Comamonas sp.]|uniref:hypothetical protein n=1 Tax=Comamonas sp. TaxID=34028 RepID=UPI0028AF0B35|nr:hypothetical protein [Comamonas sp.]
MAADLLKTSVNRQNCMGLKEGRLVLVSPFYPEAGFNAGNAMGRNKYIYALSDRALVIDPALGSGGTWEGALEVLAQQWVPLYVRTPGNGPGNAALVEKGGIEFTFVPSRGELLLDYFERSGPSVTNVSESARPQQNLLSIASNSDDALSLNAFATGAEDETPVIGAALEALEQPSDMNDGATDQVSETAVPKSPLGVQAVQSLETAASVSNDSTPITFDMYEDFLKRLSSALRGGRMSEEDVAECLVLEKGQTKVWLNRAVEAGQVEKMKKPVRYAQGRQSSLLS